MNAKRTPGPWTVGKQQPFMAYGSREVVAAANALVAVVWNGWSGKQEVADANAALIAAAPDMLEALQWIASCECEDENDNSHLYDKAREAIRKATGESK